VAQRGVSIKVKGPSNQRYILLDDHHLSSLLFIKDNRAGYISEETSHTKVSQIVPHQMDTVCFMDDGRIWDNVRIQISVLDGKSSISEPHLSILSTILEDKYSSC